MNTEKLKSANIPETWWLNCYISPDGLIFTPSFATDGNMTKTGEETYNDWVDNRDSPPQPSDVDILGQMVVGLTLQNIQLNSTVDTLGAAFSQAQLDIMTLKGGAV